MSKKFLYLITGGIGALMLAAAALFVYTHAASAATPNVVQTVAQTAARTVNETVLPQAGTQPGMHGDHGGYMAGYDQALADALGITLEELQTAYTTANTAAVNQAVADGIITQEQADAILSGDQPGGHHMGFRGAEVDYKALLADALNVSVDKLTAAEATARKTVIDQAVADGNLTQEQADLMLAQSALQPYLQQAMTDAYEQALQDAVADGALTQAQADLLRSNAAANPGGFGRGFGGPDGMGGHGHHHGGPGGAPDGSDAVPTTTPSDDTSGS